MKVYLPAFNLTTTINSIKSAAKLQQGMLELLQYRGNCVKLFDEIEEESSSEKQNESLGIFMLNSIVGRSTKNQIFASVLYNTPWQETLDASRHLAERNQLEQWEIDYCAACALFCQFKFEECTMKCVDNLHKNANDIFSLRALFVSAYFTSDTDIVATACTNMSRHYRQVQKELLGKCFLLPALTCLDGYSAYSIEETRQPLDIAQKIAINAIQDTISLNQMFFSNDDEDENIDKWWFTPENEESKEMKIPLNESFRNAATTTDEKSGKVTQRGFTCIFAVHAVCHVFETNGDFKSGIAWLSDAARQKLWLPAIHLASHVWWHMSLFYFNLGDVGNAMNIYRTYLGSEEVLNNESDPFTISDASALMIRIQLQNEIKKSCLIDVTAPPLEVSSMEQQKVIIDENNVVQQHEDEINRLNTIWGQYDESSYPNKFTKLIPFFHVHKKLIELCAELISKNKKQQEISQKTWIMITHDESENSRNNLLDCTEIVSETKRKRSLLFLSMLNAKEELFNNTEISSADTFSLLNESGFRKVLISFYFIAVSESRGGDELAVTRPSTMKMLQLVSTQMGGSIAQRNLIEFYFKWLVVTAVQNGFVSRSDPMFQNLLSKTRMDDFVFSNFNTSS